MDEVTNKIFRSEVVTVDNTAFTNCDFEGATLLYNGGTLPSFERCNFEEITLQFGGSASRTLKFLSRMRSGSLTGAVDRILDGARPKRT